MMEENQKTPKLLNVSFWVLFVTAILLPVFFIPGVIFPLSFSKSILVYSGVSLSLIFLSLYVFKSGRISLRYNPVFLGVFLIIGSFLLSTIMSENFARSEIGYGFETGTFSFIFLLFTAFFLGATLFQSSKRINKANLILIVPFIVLSIYHLLKLFFGWDLISFGGIFSEKISTPIGSFNEIGILAGVVTLISVIALDILRFQNISKILYKISLTLGLIMLVVINFWLSWIMLLVSLVLFSLLKITSKKTNVSGDGSTSQMAPNQNKGTSQVGRDIVFQNKSPEMISIHEKNQNKSSNFSFISIIVALVSLVFIFPSGTFITQKIHNFFVINFTEVRLSIQGTGEIISSTLKQDKVNFILGSGPNNFLQEWRLGKPENINLTNFWNTEFHYAVGLIPTFFVTTGFLGIISWLLFLISFCVLGFRHIRSNPKNFISVSLFFASLYLWFMTIFYLPSYSLFLYAALFSGIFLASYFRTLGTDSTLVNNPSIKTRRNFVLIAVFIVFVAVNLVNSVLVYKKSIAAFSFEKGLASFYAGNLKEAENNFKKALTVSENDIYRRSLSEFYVLKLQQFTQDIKEPTPEQVKTFEQIFQNAIQNIEVALRLNPNNLENRIQLGKIYQFLAEIQTKGAYNTAKGIYLGAQTLDPHNPILNFLLANLEVSSGTLDEALKFVTDAISQKPNFGDAMLLHSRIKFLQKDIDGAIISAIETIKVFPKEPYLYFHLGLLFYQKEDYENAATVLNEAVVLLPDFANARYFAGLSLAQLGKNAEAIVHFEKIKETNSDSAEVKLILENLKAGKDPFFNAKAPTNVDPKKRSELPLEEEN
ncbi:MAG: tetratricopeptide repeat protein [Patescibacteria group bacterium]